MDGSSPTGLIQASDGNLYGSTNTGGANGDGIIFRITTKGKLTTLYAFCSETNCTDGAVPNPLIQTTDGDLFGTTQAGGANTNQICFGSCGTAFKIALKGGSPTTVYNFCALANCADGATPLFGLIQATDGNFYGSTLDGNVNGTLFRLTPKGKVATLHTFTAGFQTPEALFQATDGVFFGVTLAGGTYDCGPYNCGIAFSVDASLSAFVETVPGAGKVGAKFDILGQGLKGTTSVSFNGTAAEFVVHSGTFLTATVPSGATTGYVKVTSGKTVTTSNRVFRVIP